MRASILSSSKRFRVILKVYSLSPWWHGSVCLRPSPIPGNHANFAQRFEIALWSSCMRLSTWRNKPEPKVASRGGLKKSPTQAAPTETVDPFRSGGEIEGATLVGGARAPPAAIAGATGIKGTSEESRERDSGSPAVAHDIFDKAGDGPGRGEKIQAINALAAAAVEVEGELHDALSPGSRQAEARK